MASTPDDDGYWLVSSSGQVFAYGHAGRYAPVHPAHPIVGIVPATANGYWLYTHVGNVYSRGAAQWYGSPAANLRGATITGMDTTPD